MGGLGGGGEQLRLAAALVGGDGLAGGDQGVHHGLVAHPGPGHLVQCLQSPGEHGLQSRHIHLVPGGSGLLQPVQPGVPERNRAAAVEHHNGHGRVVQHGLDAVLRFLHCLGNGSGNFAHGQAVVCVAEPGVDLREHGLSGCDLGAGVRQTRGKFRFLHCGTPSFPIKQLNIRVSDNGALWNPNRNRVGFLHKESYFCANNFIRMTNKSQ